MDRIAVIAELARRLPEPALLVTGDGLVIAASPACREIFGPEILEGRALAEYVATPSADVAEFLALSARSRQVVDGLAVGGGTRRALLQQRRHQARRPRHRPVPRMVARETGPQTVQAAE